MTHRLESVVACDRIFVMEAGRIVEAGSYRELVANNGAFARLSSGGNGAEAAPAVRTAGLRLR